MNTPSLAALLAALAATPALAAGTMKAPVAARGARASAVRLAPNAAGKALLPLPAAFAADQRPGEAPAPAAARAQDAEVLGAGQAEAARTPDGETAARAGAAETDGAHAAWRASRDVTAELADVAGRLRGRDGAQLNRAQLDHAFDLTDVNGDGVVDAADAVEAGHTGVRPEARLDEAVAPQTSASSSVPSPKEEKAPAKVSLRAKLVAAGLILLSFLAVPHGLWIIPALGVVGYMRALRRGASSSERVITGVMYAAIGIGLYSIGAVLLLSTASAAVLAPVAAPVAAVPLAVLAAVAGVVLGGLGGLLVGKQDMSWGTAGKMTGFAFLGGVAGYLGTLAAVSLAAAGLAVLGALSMAVIGLVVGYKVMDGRSDFNGVVFGAILGAVAFGAVGAIFGPAILAAAPAMTMVLAAAWGIALSTYGGGLIGGFGAKLYAEKIAKPSTPEQEEKLARLPEKAFRIGLIAGGVLSGIVALSVLFSVPLVALAGLGVGGAWFGHAFARIYVNLTVARSDPKNYDRIARILFRGLGVGAAIGVAVAVVIGAGVAAAAPAGIAALDGLAGWTWAEIARMAPWLAGGIAGGFVKGPKGLGERLIAMYLIASLSALVGALLYVPAAALLGAGMAAAAAAAATTLALLAVGLTKSGKALVMAVARHPLFKAVLIGLVVLAVANWLLIPLAFGATGAGTSLLAVVAPALLWAAVAGAVAGLFAALLKASLGLKGPVIASFALTAAISVGILVLTFGGSAAFAATAAGVSSGISAGEGLGLVGMVLAAASVVGLIGLIGGGVLKDNLENPRDGRDGWFRF